MDSLAETFGCEGRREKVVGGGYEMKKIFLNE